jgi:hypothetical protein
VLLLERQNRSAERAVAHVAPPFLAAPTETPPLEAEPSKENCLVIILKLQEER